MDLYSFSDHMMKCSHFSYNSAKFGNLLKHSWDAGIWPDRLWHVSTLASRDVALDLLIGSPKHVLLYGHIDYNLNGIKHILHRKILQQYTKQICQEMSKWKVTVSSLMMLSQCQLTLNMVWVSAKLTSECQLPHAYRTLYWWVFITKVVYWLWQSNFTLVNSPGRENGW